MDVLEKLDLNNNLLDSLPGDVFVDLPKIQDINLAYNRLDSISSSLFTIDLENLYSLNFRGNRIASVDPAAFTYLPKLGHLDLSENLLTSIDTCFGANLLNFLNISHNQITALNLSAMHIADLNYLHINNNMLTYLPAYPQISKLQKLIEITLDGNPWQCSCLDDVEKLLTMWNVQFLQTQTKFGTGSEPICVQLKEMDKRCVRDLTNLQMQSIICAYGH